MLAFHSYSKQKLLNSLILSTVIVFAIGIRLTGITWGLPTQQLPMLLHPDEIRVINSLASLDIAKGEFTPSLGHMDGILSYYIWTSVFGAAKFCGLIDSYPYKAKFGEETYRKLLIIGRVTVVVFDIASIILVYIVLRRMKVRALYAIIGSAALAFTPIEAIYSHYMRPHVISNFFVTLVIYATILMTQSLRIRYYILTGAICGLATSSMYPAILTLIIPTTAILYSELVQKRKILLGPGIVTDKFLMRSLIALFSAFLIGFVLSDPMLIINFKAAVKPLAIQWSEAVDKSNSGFEIISRAEKIATYLTTLIPRGAGPFLWILLYFSFFAALAKKRRRIYTLPLCIFILVDIVCMGAMYFHRAEFVRTVIMIFPPLAILLGVTIEWLHSKISSAILKYTLTLSILFVLGASLIFDAAYVTGMNAVDSRIQLLNYLDKQYSGRKLHIGVIITTWMTSTIASPLTVLQNEGKAIITPIYPQTPEDVIKKQDYICFVEFMMDDAEKNSKMLGRLMHTRGYSEATKLQNTLSFLGIRFNNSNLPHDMAYPFPKFVLLQKKMP